MNKMTLSDKGIELVKMTLRLLSQVTTQTDNADIARLADMEDPTASNELRSLYMDLSPEYYDAGWVCGSGIFSDWHATQISILAMNFIKLRTVPVWREDLRKVDRVIPKLLSPGPKAWLRGALVTLGLDVWCVDAFLDKS